MRIAQVAPLWFSLPPKKFGGTDPRKKMRNLDARTFMDEIKVKEIDKKTGKEKEVTKIVIEEPINEAVYEEEIIETPPKAVHPKLPRLEYIGQYLGTYLITQNEEGLYLIDQHAAAERVRYENYFARMSTVEVQSTELLIPITLNLSNQEVFALQGNYDLFTPLGLDLNSNDFKGVDIIRVPTWFPESFEREYTEEIIRYILDGKDVTIGDIRDSLAKSLSCKHSIKANKYINKNEIEKLLVDLTNCVNPYTCPHGRPVIIKFTQTEIEKMFKRIM